MDVASISRSDTTLQGLRYLTVGVGSALLELGLFTVLFRVSGGRVPFANLTAVCVATTVNFAANRQWAFRSEGKALRSIALYLILFAFNAAFTTFAIGALVSAGVWPWFAKGLTMVLVAAWNFVAYRRVVFA